MSVVIPKHMVISFHSSVEHPKCGFWLVKLWLSEDWLWCEWLLLSLPIINDTRSPSGPSPVNRFPTTLKQVCQETVH